MIDQDRLNASLPKIDKALINAKGQGIKEGLFGITYLIRSIQRVEGNFDCF